MGYEVESESIGTALPEEMALKTIEDARKFLANIRMDDGSRQFNRLILNHLESLAARVTAMEGKPECGIDEISNCRESRASECIHGRNTSQQCPECAVMVRAASPPATQTAEEADDHLIARAAEFMATLNPEMILSNVVAIAIANFAAKHAKDAVSQKDEEIERLHRECEHRQKHEHALQEMVSSANATTEKEETWAKVFAELSAFYMQEHVRHCIKESCPYCQRNMAIAKAGGTHAADPR